MRRAVGAGVMRLQRLGWGPRGAGAGEPDRDDDYYNTEEASEEGGARRWGSGEGLNSGTRVTISSWCGY